ncbi:acyl-CoA/acyl-ACP dehydrogenase [Kocuria sp. p3-SID1433]|uniref:acyl-CoA dehydrogenase family protein n=1 Tax=unclassified Kocuria TaxID=2649579 RepID=UPI0021A3253F|nr:MULTISPECIES: acyl-CoA dehydrogenase family protein [unclassified Kocuria]MCT1602126.1 acyl-CoA/acyl-ACP dehydrogenase [Kocuria sp. p3-SID1428]MCT2179619.1 acyl-CoA/acyl-ACP dehydrogenase [Kocuria sp. p3-SID1433]
MSAPTRENRSGSGEDMERRDWSERIDAVVAAAAAAASDVDAQGRFPQEMLDAAREQLILGAHVPAVHGGLGRSITEICRLVEALGAVCASSAAVIAMHFSQELCLTRHVDLEEDTALSSFTCAVAAEQLLLASSTTEKNIGGDTRTSSCAVVAHDDGSVTVAKSAPVISYGRFADAILVTARRDPEAPASEQSLVVVPREHLSLERTSEWDALGLRGTMSEGFELEGTVSADMVLPVDFATISAQTMLPASHTLWASSWLGLATGAGAVARRFIQKKARSNPGTTPPGALRLAELELRIQSMTDTVRSSIARFEEAAHDPELATSMHFAIAMNTLKVSTSESVRAIVSEAMVIVGIASYSNTGPFSLARSLRDAMGPSLQVNNDRILNSSASLLTVSKGRA